MIVEHFIDPLFLIEVAKSRRDCIDFYREFTKPSPRVVGAFPKLKRLRKLALSGQSDDVPDLEKLRLLELLKIISDTGIVKRNLEFDDTMLFQSNLQQAENYFFKGFHLLYEINEDIGLQSKRITYADFSGGLDPLVSQRLASRTAEGISTALGELLRLSQHITLVDPYFSTQPGVWKTFLKCLEKAATDSPVQQKIFSVLFDGSKKNACSCRYLTEVLKKEKLEFLHQYDLISFKDIREIGKEAIHNRYVITELAAVSIGYGFHETNEHESDDVTLLSRDVYEKRYGQYVELQDFRLESEEAINI